MKKAVLLIIFIFVFLDIGQSYQVIVESPIEVLFFDKICPSLNITSKECILFFDFVGMNETTIVNKTIIVNNTFVNKTILNYTTYINVSTTKTIVVNSTKIYNNSRQIELDHEYRMEKLKIDSKSNKTIDLSNYLKINDLDKYVLKSEFENYILSKSDDIIPVLKDNPKLEIYFLPGIIILIIGFIIYKKLTDKKPIFNPVSSDIITKKPLPPQFKEKVKIVESKESQLKNEDGFEF